MQALAGALRRIVGVLRPAEWVILLFLLYMSRFDHTGMRALPVLPGAVIAAMLLVTAIRQGLAHRARPWPEDAEPVDRFRAWAPRVCALLGVLLAGWGLLHRAPPAIEAGVLAGVLRILYVLIRNLLVPVLPVVVVALGLGLHLKAHRTLVPGALLRETLGELWAMVRAWAPPSLMLFLYGLMSAALSNLRTPDADPALAAVDRLLCLGHEPVLALQHVVSRPLSEWLAFSYMGYLFFYPVGLGTLYVAAREHFDEVVFALTLCLALGFVGYTLVPARGPMFAQHFTVSLDGYYLESIKAQLMDRYRAPRDCFPSLHTAVAVMFLIYARRFAPRLFWALLPVAASTPLACVYLRYHYLTDVLAGAALAASCVVAARAAFSLGRSSAPLPAPEAAGAPSST